MDQKTKLVFVPFMSNVNPSFWNKLTELKLNIDKIKETNRNIWGFYSNLAKPSTVRSILEVDSTSFNSDANCSPGYLAAHGKIINKNTIEQFKNCAKQELITEEAKLFWKKVETGEILENPSLMNFFLILSFADLKKYHYYYWFAFPVPSNILADYTKIAAISNVFNETQLTQLYEGYENLAPKDKTHFVIHKCEGGLLVDSLTSIIRYPETNYFLQSQCYYFAFADISSSPEQTGWPLRNFLAVISFCCPELRGKDIEIVSFRLYRCSSLVTCNSSLVLTLTVPEFEENIIWTGWEKNKRGHLGPRFVSMRDSMDPKNIAESSVDLNLKLMKWRLAPDVNLDKIKNARCLLLGSGTLGCSVARNLMAWGVRNITLVDNSHVSYSNPVRQSLFTFEDSVRNKPKAEAAADTLRAIFPGVNAKGVHLSIPMPGHPVGKSLLEKTGADVETLCSLIKANDVIFLLMDSRESRWLPTVMCNCFCKIVITAALGFDSYLVMRHGVQKSGIPSPKTNKNQSELKSIPGDKLACYFCCDVTAPGNSNKDRSLDQQCTVARPGASAVAGGLAAELAISLIQHKSGVRAPAFYVLNETSTVPVDECVLGMVPHAIRGFLSSFTQITPATERYEQCVACSEPVLNEYKSRGFDFLMEVFESSVCLEKLTGLDQLLTEVDEEKIMELDSDSDASP